MEKVGGRRMDKELNRHEGQEGGRESGGVEGGGLSCAPCEDAIRCSPLCQCICRLPSDVLEEKKKSKKGSSLDTCRSLLRHMSSGREREREHGRKGGAVGFTLSFIGWLD